MNSLSYNLSKYLFSKTKKYFEYNILEAKKLTVLTVE